MSRTMLRRTMRSRFRVFSPMDIPDLGLDLDASYGVLNSIGPDVPATDGQTVRRWLDKSGNGRDYDQTTATNQPSFAAGGFNGLAAVYFDGVNDFLRRLNDDLTNAKPGVTMFVVCQFESISVNRNPFNFSVGTGIGFRAGVQKAFAGFQFAGRRLDGDSVGVMSAGSADVNPHFFSGVFDYDSALLSAYVDGGSQGVLAPFQTPGVSSATNSQAATLGCTAANVDFFLGPIARVLVWPRALTAPELAQVHAYLSQTYGIPLA